MLHLYITCLHTRSKECSDGSATFGWCLEGLKGQCISMKAMQSHVISQPVKWTVGRWCRWWTGVQILKMGLSVPIDLCTFMIQY